MDGFSVKLCTESFQLRLNHEKVIWLVKCEVKSSESDSRVREKVLASENYSPQFTPIKKRERKKKIGWKMSHTKV